MDSKLKKERFQATLNSLNESQRESVLSNVNTLQILAGPGSGKTRVLTCRVAYFVAEKCIPPQSIIVVTFTNKAASEMKKRLNYLIGEESTKSLLLGTFHAICCRMLHLHAKFVDLDPNFTVADTEISKEIIDKLRKDRQLKIGKFTREVMNVGAIWAIISKAKNRGETCAIYEREYGSDFATKDIAILYTRYEAELERLNMDFDNLIIKACELLRKKKNILNNVKAILVDEFQDTNSVQYELVKLMKMQDNNKEVTIVGDPDQSIYGFREAQPMNFRKMQNDYSDVGVINMEENYRSTGNILKAALHVITQDSSRFNKSLRTKNPDGKPIFRISTDNEETQAEFVAKEIKKAINGSMGLINYKDIAVLMRMNFISREFEVAFKRYKIPFTIVGGDRFFDRVEGKDILSYLNFAYNPSDLLSINRIVNVPKRGIGAANLKKLIEKNEQDGTDLLETIIGIGRSKSGKFGALVKTNLLELGSICTTLKKMMTNQESVPKIIQYLLDAIRYNDYLKEHYFKDHEARWNNIGELISVAQKAPSDDEATKFSNDEHKDDQLEPMPFSASEKEPERDNVADFLDYCALCSNQKELEEAEGGKVAVATLHASNGLEWPCVFIVTCNDGVIPHTKSMKEIADIEEECRLLYVGITRSKFLMYCVSPNQLTVWGQIEPQHETQFLIGMNEELFSTNPPQWDDEIRVMLAQTIGKEVTLNGDVAVNNLKRSYDDDSDSTTSSIKTENYDFQDKRKKMKLNGRTYRKGILFFSFELNQRNIIAFPYFDHCPVFC